MPVGLTHWLDRIDASQLPHLRILVYPQDFRPAIEPMLDDCGMPCGDMRDLIVADIETLISVYAKIARTDLVDVRLESIDHDACWKFHRDSVEMRLLTTYRGPATEWVCPNNADTALQQQKDYDGPIETLRLHDIALFKGNRAGTEDGIVHRSPPIAGTMQTRLLLCLNTPSTTSPEQWRAA